MKVLVTGGTGFIGSYVLLELIRRKEETIVFDIEPSSRVAKNIQENTKWVQGDIRNGENTEAVIREYRPDVVINLAGLLQYGCMENPRRAIEVNVLGLSNVLEGGRKCGVKRIVTASSAAAYGFFTKQVQEREPIPTDVTLYGATKFIGEILGRQYIENYGMEVVNLRYFGVYGPGEVRSPGMAKVIKDIESIVTGKSVVLPTVKGSDHTHLIFVADAAYATVLAAVVPGPLSLVFNVAGGPESYITFDEIVSIIQGMALNCGQVTFQGKGRDRGPMDITLAQKELGFKPRYTPQEGFLESVKYFMEKK